MFRPTNYPGWASGPSGWLAEPTATVKALGWQPGQAPPSAYQNWLDNISYNWIRYFDRMAGGVLLTKMVEDDFAYGPANVRQATGMGNWETSPSFVQFVQGATGMVGIARVGNVNLSDFSPSGQTGYMRKPIGAVDGRDLIIDFIGRYDMGLGVAAEVGIFDHLAFVASGPSTYWNVAYRPSGAGSPTYMPLTGYLPTGIHRLTMDLDGGNLNVMADGAAFGTFSGIAVGNTTSMNFGARQLYQLSNAAKTDVDFLSLRIGRNPT